MSGPGASTAPPDLAGLQARAAADRRICAVGALIRDGAGRVFVHRRGAERAFLPNAWDIVGGHVEPGEDLLAALRREVEEETGWTVRGKPVLMHVEDWAWRDERVREFDFYVEVDGDLGRPRLEVPEHVELRWIGPGDVGVLDENRGADGGFIRRNVEKALAGAGLGDALPASPSGDAR